MNRLLATTLVVSVGCTSGGSGADTDSDDAPLPVWPQPALSITSPAADGALATDGTLMVTVALTEFDLTGVISTDARWKAPPLPWLWLLPTADAHQPGDKPNGFIGVTVDDLTDADPPRDWLAADTTTFTLTGLPPGELVVTTQLYWPDRESFYPPVLDTVRVVVPGDDTDPADTDADTDPEVP